MAAHRKSRSKSGRRQETSNDPWLLSFDQLSSGRMLAWYALQQFDETGRFLTEILGRSDTHHDLAAQERGLAVDVAAGVVRRRRTLDVLLESQISRPRAKVEPDLWRLLQLGALQIVFSRAPSHAAVDTTVELARVAGRSRWCGFANGILRNIARLITEDFTDALGMDCLPLEDGRFLRLNQSLFPDPTTKLADCVGQTFSLPRSIARRWSQRMTYYELMNACFHSLAVPTTVLRVNRLAASVGQVQSALEDQNIDVAPGANDWSLRLQHAARIPSLPGFEQGWWSVQDESAMLAAELLAPQPGEHILDLCAAPGGKTTHLAELSGDKATIVACDVSDSRLSRVDESVERLQLTSVQTQLIDRDCHDLPPGPYDAALIDVPCSNTGVLSRRPEARWRFREDELSELVELQTRLLLTAYENVQPGGRLVYSTCSIEPEETTELISNVTQAMPKLTLQRENLQLPGQQGDGAYQALLIREA